MIDEGLYFSRQRPLRQVDLARLRRSSALVLGLGNVCGPAAAYIAMAGVGRMVLVDNDAVRQENLSRGIFGPADVGKLKVQAAADWIADRAPFTDVTTLSADLRVEVPEGLFSSCDAVLIATDSWSSRMHANRWAHAVPGRTRIVVSGGLTGLSWDVVSSVPGSGLGCAQCPHSPDILYADQEGGCSPQSRPEEVPIDPSMGFTGGAVAAVMAAEVAVSLGGSGPRFAGRMVSFDHEGAAFQVRRIVPNPDCFGHRPLAEQEESLVVPLADYGVGELAAFVAREFGLKSEDVTLVSDREIVRSRSCTSCGLVDEVRRPLLAARGDEQHECAGCGGHSFDFEVQTVLDEPELRLSDVGLATGKVVYAYLSGRRVTVLPLGEGCR